jgi:cell division transport system permease protein
MLITNLRRIVKSGFVNFWRNGFVSLAAVLVMTVTLFVVGSLLFAQAMLGIAIEQLKDKVDVNVYFTTTTEESVALELKGRIEKLPEVAFVEYLSRDAVLLRFREQNKTNQTNLSALEELGENPFGASLSIKTKELSQYAGVASFLDSETRALVDEDGISMIDSVNYAKNRIVIERLSDIIDTTEKFGLVVFAVLAIASVIIIFSTIRLAIYTAREEIAVMRLVGASNSYIRGPFMFEGIVYGLVAGIIVLALFYPATYSLGPKTEDFFGFADANIFTYYMDNILLFLLVVVGSGVVLGALSSFLAVKKYLNV